MWAFGFYRGSDCAAANFQLQMDRSNDLPYTFPIKLRGRKALNALDSSDSDHEVHATIVAEENGHP